MLVTSPVLLFAQAWNTDSYLKWNEKNFRKNPAFKAKIKAGNPDYRLLNAAVFFVSNETRVKNGKMPNTFSPLLEASSFHHSRSMVEQSFFSHTNPNDVNRKTTTDRGKLAGIENPYIAENIAMFGVYNLNNLTYLDVAQRLVDMWYNSPGHRDILLSDNTKKMGCGVYLDPGGAVYGTQNFQWFYDVVEASNIEKDRLP